MHIKHILSKQFHDHYSNYNHFFNGNFQAIANTFGWPMIFSQIYFSLLWNPYYGWIEKIIAETQTECNQQNHMN